MSYVLLAVVSCAKSDLPPDVCVGGDCFAKFSLGVPIDSNGFYHIPLNYDGEYDPRFTILAEASAINSEFRYNDVSAVSATFKGNKRVEVSVVEHLNITEFIPLVQESAVYFSGNTSVLTSKRIVGPVKRELKGDTLTIQVKVVWDAGLQSQNKTFSLKIILE